MTHSNGTHPFLTLPPELRNAIYDHVYVTPSPYLPVVKHIESSPIRDFFSTTFGRKSPLDQLPTSASNKPICGLIQSCKQLHAEAHVLYFLRTNFILSGPYATPEYFERIVAPLSAEQVRHIRHITLTGRINNLRALNESWNGVPFNDPNIHLSTLTIVPRRPQNHESQYAEIADLSQSHTLAHLLAETLKTLRGIDRIIVRNDEECFNPIVWRLVYRSLVYRLWNWGGANLGLKFRPDPSDQHAWFEILLGSDASSDDEDWREADQEVERLLGTGNTSNNT